MDYNGRFIEDDLEQAIISLFQEQGYTYVPGETINRQYEDILLLEDLKNYIISRYGDANLTEIEIQEIIDKLELISEVPLYIGNRETFRLINEGFDLVRQNKTLQPIHIEYINFDEPDKNTFKIVNQYTVQGKHERRPDLLVFINGIPVAIFELKTVSNENVPVYDAWEQIAYRYCRDIPRLMKYCFLSVISDGANTRMGTIFTQYIYYYAWNKVNAGDEAVNGGASLFSMMSGAFTKERIIAILRDFIFYPDGNSNKSPIVCRYPQFFAANKMMESIKANLRPIGKGKGGTYFGATGSGKTYAMLFLARMLGQRDNSIFKNPTIILVVDRDDLDSQTSEIFVTAKEFLGEEDVRSIDTREDLKNTLFNRPSGGVYVTTIQKFCEDIGLLSNRSNIICISDEAHRTQTGIGERLVVTDERIESRFGFAKYLRDSFPNATYCGFTGTPTDESLAVFGPVVDSYTMEEAVNDGITVRITCEPRLARVALSDEQVERIQAYYNECAEEGAKPEQIRKSQEAMSSVTAILGNTDRIKKLARDIVNHYEALCQQKPKIVQKAMIVCANRQNAFKVLKAILELKPEWGENRRAEDESALTEEMLDRLLPIPKINLVATQGQNDEEELFNLCGSKEYHKMLDKQFKNNDSNFKIAVVVDMWITGFDVPSLAVMYLDKPVQKHNLVQTISRVNRVFKGKDEGLVVDYIGIKKALGEAMIIQGGMTGNPIKALEATLVIFRNLLASIDNLLAEFDATKFYSGLPLERFRCLTAAAEYVQMNKDRETEFMNLTRQLRCAFDICYLSDKPTKEELSKANFYLALRSAIYKQTNENVPDTEAMNSVVQKMVEEAISCTGVESVVSNIAKYDVIGDSFRKELNAIKMPITKFNYLLKLLKKTIRDYGRKNMVRAIEFDKRLQKVVDEYNCRDAFTEGVFSDFVDNLSERMVQLYNEVQEDERSFEKLGVSFEEKVFYDILVKVRDDHKFVYEDEKCVTLAREIKKIVDEKARLVDWSKRNDIRSALERDLILLLCEYKYPHTWSREIFNKIMEQKGYIEEDIA